MLEGEEPTAGPRRCPHWRADGEGGARGEDVPYVCLHSRSTPDSAVDWEQAARSLGGWSQPLEKAGPQTEGDASGGERKVLEKVPGPDPSLPTTASIMSIIQQVSAIEVNVDYMDGSIEDVLARIRQRRKQAAGSEEATSGRASPVSTTSDASDSTGSSGSDDDDDGSTTSADSRSPSPASLH
ncbi:uncharacterized protein LOC144139046 [Haemaphysalis longicornis]